MWTGLPQLLKLFVIFYGLLVESIQSTSLLFYIHVLYFYSTFTCAMVTLRPWHSTSITESTTAAAAAAAVYAAAEA